MKPLCYLSWWQTGMCLNWLKIPFGMYQNGRYYNCRTHACMQAKMSLNRGSKHLKPVFKTTSLIMSRVVVETWFLLSSLFLFFLVSPNNEYQQAWSSLSNVSRRSHYCRWTQKHMHGKFLEAILRHFLSVGRSFLSHFFSPSFCAFSFFVI